MPPTTGQNLVVPDNRISLKISEVVFKKTVSTMHLDTPGGPLECQGGYQARPKIHVIRVVFQDQALYARTSFRGAKTCKIEKKGVFLVI